MASPQLLVQNVAPAMKDKRGGASVCRCHLLVREGVENADAIVQVKFHILSSIVDNVPLVAGCMGMYPVQTVGDMAVDGIFWQLLAYCAGVGGSMLIIGSAAGVVVMGLEKITFGWYLRRITWIAFVGYIFGIISYWALRTFVFGV